MITGIEMKVEHCNLVQIILISYVTLTIAC
jgi:hypothetical protein